MNKTLLSLYGLKWNPFSPELPTEALRLTSAVENFAWRIEHSLVREGGFALVLVRIWGVVGLALAFALAYTVAAVVAVAAALVVLVGSAVVLLASLVGVHAFQGTRWTVAGEVPQAQGNHHPSIAPYGLFRCADGAVQVACGNEGMWHRLCAEFGLDPQTPGLETNTARVGNRQQVIDLLETAFADVPGQEVLDRLASAGVPSGRVRDLQEVYEWDQTRSQGLLVDVEHPTLGQISLPGPPLRFFDGAGAEQTRTAHTSPPQLNQDADAIRAWLQEPPAER